MLRAAAGAHFLVRALLFLVFNFELPFLPKPMLQIFCVYVFLPFYYLLLLGSHREECWLGGAGELHPGVPAGGAGRYGA